MFLVLLSLVASVSMDTAGYFEAGNNTTRCMMTLGYDDFQYPSPQNPALLLIQLILSAISHMLIYTAVFTFEFRVFTFLVCTCTLPDLPFCAQLPLILYLSYLVCNTAQKAIIVPILYSYNII